MSDSTIPLKKCTKCGNEYPATTEFFTKDKRGKYGLNYYCKSCQKKANEDYRKTHKQQMREATRRWIQAHPDQQSSNVQRWVSTHREQIRKTSGVYRERKREQIRQWTRLWIKRNPDKVRQHHHNRRARKHSAIGTHTDVDIAAQLKRQRGCCYYAACGHCKLGNKYHVEHVIPLTRKGARNDMSNIVLSCPSCNLKKGTKLPHEWTEGGRLL